MTNRVPIGQIPACSRGRVTTCPTAFFVLVALYATLPSPSPFDPQSSSQLLVPLSLCAKLVGSDHAPTRFHDTPTNMLLLLLSRLPNEALFPWWSVSACLWVGVSGNSGVIMFPHGARVDQS